MCNLSDFTIPQLRLIQDGIASQISENNGQLFTLEDIYEITELNKHPIYLERKKRKEDLYQVATKILETLVAKRVVAKVTCN